MAKTPRLTKTVSARNLERLGAARLAVLLEAAADAQPAFRRRLRLELAAEIGVEELDLELGRRLTILSQSRAKVSWRKRPELIRELVDLLRLILERLAPEAAAQGLARLADWIELSSRLAARVKDPKGEVAAVFVQAAPALVKALDGADAPDLVARRTLERPEAWAVVLGPAITEMSPGAAAGLLRRLGARPDGRLNRLRRRLADRAGDVDAWADTLSPAERRQPEIIADLAGRLAQAGRAGPARAALDAVARLPGGDAARVRQLTQDATIAVLDAEGRDADALEARWARFESRLTVEALSSITDRLDDFEDVVAADRAVAYAARAFDLMAGLDFLMAWGAPSEAADAIEARTDALRGDREEMALWAARLAGRRPRAALLLLRARLGHLIRTGGEVEGLEAEAEALSHQVPDLQPHADFLAGFRAGSPAAIGRRRWR
ncbi:MAG: DUF6880 family protein [Brevundimonas sp.]|uniref:DUF6880 family protein n=1 Tax=Brevundimonas sp. TaxID=1871086 RepID=UPI00391990E4